MHIGFALSATWLSGNGWRRPDSRVEEVYTVDFWAPIARRAEAAKLDFLFRPDALFMRPETLADSPGFSGPDPLVLLSGLARETERIGLVTTSSTTFTPPFYLARQLQSLNWISHGRAGWNVVTSLDGHANFGAAAMPSSEARYAQARECVEVVQRLWESFPAEALQQDRAAGRFADTAQIVPIDHRGPHFRVTGPPNLPGHPAGTIPLFQAGASPAGRDFAARIAAATFAATPDLAAGVELRTDLRRRATAHGRSPDSVRVLPGLSLYLAPTAAEARALFRETHAHPAYRPRLIATVRELVGLDVSPLPADHHVTLADLPAGHRSTRSGTHVELLRRLIARDRPTVADLLGRPEVAGSAHWIVVGTPDDALREIRERVDAGAADGFIALPGGSTESLDLFFDELMPRLVDAGLFRRDYTGATLRGHLGL